MSELPNATDQPEAASGTADTATGPVFDPLGDLAADRPAPAGSWTDPPASRSYGDPFNERYEEWVRSETGGPAGKEYLVRGDGRQALFDATTVREQDGNQTEVLIDAKGRYAQFIDPESGRFKDFWANSRDSGLNGELKQARRQVDVADGRPVEWWCAERQTARAFNQAFAGSGLAGHIRAVYRPMAEQEG